jgi:uncharacterized membrane protein YqhA
MLKNLLNIRYLYLLSVLFLLINAIVFVIVGVVQSIQGYYAFITVGFHPKGIDRPGLFLLEALDAFMVSLVFLVFGLGVGRLFVFNKVDESILPAWLNVHNLKELKVLLWETILVTLVILSVTNVVKVPPKSWEDLVFPVFILILALALYFVRKAD